MIELLTNIKYKKLIWVLACTETLHNLEEFLWLPDWSRRAGIWHPKVDAFEFRVLVAVITLIIYGLIYYFAVSDSKLAGNLMGITLVIILVNVFVPHLIATVVMGSFAPGVATGVLLNLPVTLYLLIRGRREGYFKFQ